MFLHAGDFSHTTYRFRNIGVQMLPLILGTLLKFAIFWLPLLHRLVTQI